jgi:hypothetical protein
VSGVPWGAAASQGNAARAQPDKDYLNGDGRKEKYGLIRGAVQLGRNLTPGKYMLELQVRDEAAAKGQGLVSQWIDFQVAPAGGFR